jgi:hypothetical protein
VYDDDHPPRLHHQLSGYRLGDRRKPPIGHTPAP